MPRLLFISPKLPLPADRGQHVRILNLLQCCAREFDVTFLCPAPENGVDVSELHRLCRDVIFIDPVTPAPSFLAVLGHVLRARSLASPRRYAEVAGFAKALAALDPGEFELIWVERPMLSALVRQHWQRTIVDLDDLEHRKLWREMEATGWWRHSFRDVLKILKHFMIETRVARRFLAALVCSDEDRQYLEARGLHNVWVVPNGTDLAAAQVAHEADVNVYRLAFMGNLSYAPNADAVAFLTGAVLPLAAGSIGDIRLDIFGPNAPEKRPDDPWSVYRGFVPDIAAELSACDVFVAPIRFGSGTKLKIIDAMAMRMPIVTTSVGAEGLGLTHGVSAMIAESAQDLAQALVTLRRDPALAQRLGEEASRIANENFRWDSIRRATAEWLSGLAGGLPNSRLSER